MQPDQKPGAGAGDAQQGRTPNSDMQPEDAGTAESGNDAGAKGRGNATESATKQTDKTDAESDGRA